MTEVINSDKLVIKRRSRASRMALLGCTLSLILKLNNTELLEAIWPQASFYRCWLKSIGRKRQCNGYAASTQATKEEALSVPKLGAGLGEKVGLFLKKMSGEG